MARSYSQELSDIRRATANAYGRQRDVVGSTARILADVARLADRYGRNEVAPRIRDEYDHRVAPLIADGLRAGRRAWAKTPVAPKKSGLGGFIAAGFGVALIAGAAYLAWQVLRTDDEAWIDDDFDVD